MSHPSAEHLQASPPSGPKIPRPVGCCAGQAAGCGCSFLASWIMALILSVLLAPLFGQYDGGNTAAGTLLSALTCGGSLIMGAVLSFLTGRAFPVLKKGAGETR